MSPLKELIERNLSNAEGSPQDWIRADKERAGKK